MKRTVDELGRLDVLVNNAAFQNHVGDIGDLSEEQGSSPPHQIHAYFFMAKAPCPTCAGSAIVQCGSVTGLEGSGALLDYSATKGPPRLHQGAGPAVVKRGVRVNCVAPDRCGLAQPGRQKAEDVAHFGESTPMGRPAQPEEIAPAFVYFASETDSSYVTGEVLGLLGGATTAG